MELKAVIFDLGGTLIYYPFLEEIERVCKEYWQEIGVDQETLLLMYKIYMEEREKGLKTLKEATISDALSLALKERGREVEFSQFQEILWKIYYFQHSGLSYLYQGAAKALREVKKLGLKIGLVSDTPFCGRFHEKDMKRFRIFSYFDARVWSSEFGWRKPHPVIFLECLNRLGVKPYEAVYAGDRFNRDVEGPNGIRMPSILINQEEKREFYGWQVKDIREVIGIIKILKGVK